MKLDFAAEHESLNAEAKQPYIRQVQAAHDLRKLRRKQAIDGTLVGPEVDSEAVIDPNRIDPNSLWCVGNEDRLIDPKEFAAALSGWGHR